MSINWRPCIANDFLPEGATCATRISWFGADRETGLRFGRSGMSSDDIIVLSGLAGVFCWTYIILPLVFYHS
jgi:hypothetical protein